MPNFEITYTHPETGERVTIVEAFQDSPSVSAREWAEDAAYSYADKNTDYVIKLLK